jgi:hypothetical protein
VCRIEPAPLATADAWLRFYQRFWMQQLDLIGGSLRPEEHATTRRGKRARLRR